MAINLVMPERKETAGIELTGTAMLARMEAAPGAAATLTAPRRLLLGLLFLLAVAAGARRRWVASAGQRLGAAST